MFSAIKKAYQAHLQYGYKRLGIKSMFINNVQTIISGWKKRHVALDVKRTNGGKRRRRRRKQRRPSCSNLEPARARPQELGQLGLALTFPGKEL